MRGIPSCRARSYIHRAKSQSYDRCLSEKTGARPPEHPERVHDLLEEPAARVELLLPAR